MIYLVTNQKELFESDIYKHITVDESLNLLEKANQLQYDSETSGRDPHINDLLCIQFGNDEFDFRIVVDCTTVDVKIYKNILETKGLIGHNLKFDLQFLYNYNIKPRRVYDTMIVEQLLYLGYPSSQISYSLKETAWRYLNVYIDKSVRGEIIWRGLDSSVIQYAANDVVYLEHIMKAQIEQCKAKQCIVGARLECDVVPAVAYMEWCGIKLDESKWKAKMVKDEANLAKAKDELEAYAVTIPALQEFVYVNTQGDLFDGFDLTPKVTINWDSPSQIVKVAKLLGFDTTVKDKKSGEDKDSVLEKQLSAQKGIDDKFLKLYFSYKEYSKVCSTYGQIHLDSINPKTKRLHTTFKQLGAASGRFSCGSSTSNTDLAKYKKLPPSRCTYVNLQQLPSDAPTRGAFVAPEGNMMVSCDFSAEEARLGGDIYQDEAILRIFREGIDSHSMYAKIFFKEELKDVPVEEIKEKYPELRQKAKGPEFALNFGGGASAIKLALQCSDEEANTIIKNYEEGFQGTAKFAKKGSKEVRSKGYVLINPITGHKMYWWDFEHWKSETEEFNQPGFWDDYKRYHKGTFDDTEIRVKQHFKAASKWDRMARNAPCQGTGSIILKTAMTNLYNWIVDNKYFNQIHICCCVHDEIVCDYPKDVLAFPNILEDIMEKAAAKFCKSLPIPAEASVGDHWIH